MSAPALWEPPAAPMEVATERHMLDLLAVRYSATNPGNGPRYAVADHVRSHAGFDARRTADCLVVDLWPSSGLPIIGHEVKVSRSDWLRELKDPTKAEEFARYCRYWWVVVPDARMVKLDELPAGWGVLAGNTSLRVIRQAKSRHDVQEPPRQLWVCLVRSAAKTARRQP